MKKITFFIAGFLTALNLTALAVTFSDQTEFSDWNREAIFQANENQLMTGYEDGRFGVNEYVTRGELATVLQRFENERLPELLSAYQKKEGVILPPAEQQEASIDDDAILGDVNASVTLVEFADYQCPFCKKFHDEILPSIKEDYIDTGKLKLVFRDFPLEGHPDAKNAAMAAECLREQAGDSAYWQYGEILFAHQSELSIGNLKNYATGFSIDQSQFNTCLDTQQFEIEVMADLEEGLSYGTQGTPTFFIGHRMIVGAQDYEVFKEAIEELLE